MDLIQKVGNHEEYQSGRGIFLDMFIELQKCLNFTFSLKLSPDGKYGSMTKNGSWNGIIHYLWNGDFDIGILLFVYFWKGLLVLDIAKLRLLIFLEGH